MNTALLVTAAIVMIAAAFALGVYVYIKSSIINFSRKFFGTSDLSSAVETARVEAEARERSISALTSVLLPLIERDFPFFNWEECKANVGAQVREFVEKNMHGTDIVLHRTEISDYRRNQGNVYILTQTTAGHTNEEGAHIERKYETELVYVQDLTQSAPTKMGVGLNCPNCGAPITSLGVKKCPYCGTVVIEFNNRVWTLAGTKEIS